MSRLVKGGRYALLSSTEWPGVNPDEDITPGDPEALISRFPAMRHELLEFTRTR